MHAPITLHWQAVKRILQYLNGTLKHCLHFQPTNAVSLLAYSDAGWVFDNDDNISQFGFDVFHKKNLTSWTSRKQRVVAVRAWKQNTKLLHTPPLSCYGSSDFCKISNLLCSSHLLCSVTILGLPSCANIQSSAQDPSVYPLIFILSRSKSKQLADIFTNPLGKARVAQLRSKLQVHPALDLAGV
ncbi:hypothetical protein V2J09_022673 [Rumex salicifolius]